MARFEQEYCLGCTNRFEEGCAIPTKLERVANAGKAASDSIRASLLGVYPQTLVGGASAVDFYQETADCAQARMGGKAQAMIPETEIAVVLQFPHRPKQ